MHEDTEVTPVEVVTRFQTSVRTLSEVWEFVMSRTLEHQERIGDFPEIHIQPVTLLSFEDPNDEPLRLFNVTVEGTVDE